MSDVSIRKGNRLPQLERRFVLDDNVAVNLSGATVVFNMYNAITGAQVITNGTTQIVTSSSGLVRYAWSESDALLDAGAYIASFTATYGDGRQLTAPNSGMIVVEIFDTADAGWLYTSKPSARNIDKVRLLIGDTDSNDQLLTDDEVSWFLEVHGTINRSASEAARAIAAKFARLMNRSIGGLSADFSAKYRQYMELADNLLQREETSPVSPYLSGYKISEKKSVEDDIDREPTFSRKGIMDNNRAYPADNEGWTDYRRTG